MKIDFDKPSRADVIECLSTQVRDAVLSDDRHKISKACRHQLRQQLMQRHESIKLDPKLQRHCSNEVAKYCKDVTRGRGAVSSFGFIDFFFEQEDIALAKHSPFSGD